MFVIVCDTLYRARGKAKYSAASLNRSKLSLPHSLNIGLASRGRNCAFMERARHFRDMLEILQARYTAIDASHRGVAAVY